MEKAEQILQKKGAQGLKISGTGSFGKKGLSILRTFCEISDTERKVAAEAKWLPQLNLNSSEMALLKNGLWNLPSSHPLLRFENRCIDALSLSYLVEERYLDNFTIDVCIGKMIDQSNIKSTLYLPTEFYTWMENNDRDFKERQLQRQALQSHLHIYVMA